MNQSRIARGAFHSAWIAVPLAVLFPPMLLLKSRALIPALCVGLWLLALAIFFGLWAGVGFLLASLMSWVSGAIAAVWFLARR